MTVLHRPAPPTRTALHRIPLRAEGAYKGILVRHITALSRGLVELTSYEAFPERFPDRPRLFQSTQAFLGRLRAHRDACRFQPTHTVYTCPGCKGILICRAFVARSKATAIQTGDGDTEHVLGLVEAKLAQAYDF